MKQIFTDKHLDTMALALRQETLMLTFEGTIRSSKTVDAVDCFYLAVKNSPDYLHCICARDYDAVRDNLLECNGFGLTKKFKDFTREKEVIGGYFYTMRGADQKKKMILLAGYATIRQWTKILGKTIGVFLIDEANIADEQFIDESFSRQASAEKPLTILTLNGDNPDHFIYQKYINYSTIVGRCPQSIRDEMDKFPKKKGYYYFHWTMEDNPAMTPEKIERASSRYPVGSYYYVIKILGERGTPEGAIFAQYLDDSFISKDIEVVYNGENVIMDECEYLLKTGGYIKYSIGIDLGNNDAKRGTILTLEGITRGYKNFDIIDSKQCKSTESDALTTEIVDYIYEWFVEIKNDGAIDSIRIDGFGAVQVLIPTIRKKLYARGIRVYTDLAIKFGEDGGRAARLDLCLILVSQHRLRFSQRKGAKETLIQLRKLKYADDGLPYDENQLEMDYYDSMGYGMTPFTTLLTNVLR